MQFSVFDLTQGIRNRPHRDVYDHVFEQAQIAEAGGMDAYYVAEHHFDPHYSVTPSPNLLIAALAQRTSKIRIGAQTTVLPYHHPVRIAEEIRMLDVLTNGRLDVSWGRGALRLEQQGWGINRSETSEMFEEGYQLVRRLLTEETLDSYDTRWWKGGKVVVVPEAVQRPHPPFWLTAVSFTSAYKAGRLGMNLATAFRSNHERKEVVQSYRAGWEEWEAQYPDAAPGIYASEHHVFVAETLEECERFARPHLEGWMDHFLRIISDRPIDGEDPSYDTHKRHHLGIMGSSWEQMLDDCRVVYGTPDMVVAQLEKMAASGMDNFMGYFQFGECDFGASNRSLKLFCDEVMPRVKHLNARKPVGAQA